MSSTHIKTVDDLRHYLNLAMQLEHATIPVYITALYSIKPGTNPDASHIMRVIAVEEMLHLTLVANMINAIGGTPDLTVQGFVPSFPTPLPDGESDFEISLMRFSMEAVQIFCKIERPRPVSSGAARLQPKRVDGPQLGSPRHDEALSFYSIGEFYEEIRHGFESLYEQMGDSLFCGDPARQVTPEQYYSGGGKLIVVSGIESARAATELIAGQGEGLGGHVYDADGELSHYFRLDQLIQGRYYQHGDEPHAPTGATFEVDWDAVYPVTTNARLTDYAANPELYAAAEAFNRGYAQFLAQLTQTFNGDPTMLMKAIHSMFRVRDAALQLMHHPMPGLEGVNAAPTFEIVGHA